jgi:hypothetical protein
VIQTTCTVRDLRVHWIARGRERRSEFEPLDSENSFPCEHWRDHHEAGSQAFADGIGGQGEEGRSRRRAD